MGLRRFLYSFRLAVIWPLLIAGVVAGGVLWWSLPQVLEDSTARNLESVLEILAPLVGERLDEDAESLHAWVRSMTRETPVRLTVVRADGFVLADSARTWFEVGGMDNHRERPEIVAAIEADQGDSLRLSATTGLRYVYVARRVDSAAGGSVVVRLAQPLSEVRALERRLMQALWLTGAFAAVAIVLVWAGLERQLFGPLRRLTDAADALGRGETTGSIAEPRNEQLAVLGRAVERLSERVDEQIRQVRAERNQLQELLASMSDGVLVTDARNRVSLVNQAFLGLVGTAAAAAGADLVSLTRRPELLALIENGARERVAEENLPLDNGRVVAASASPVGRGGALVVLHDVTGRALLDETRRDFVANVSHEIKTPLTAIRGYAETLREGALAEPETASKFTERILGQCARLEALLADLLPLARMEAAEEQGIEFRDVDLGELVARAVEDVGPDAASRDVRLEIDVDPDLPLLDGDTEALSQLVLNLLGNAVKYNRESGSVRLSARRHPGELVLEVADTGIGIPAESVPRIFERFYRVDKGRAREEGGTGLGLALVKHAAKLHGGNVEVESQLGVGSTFRVTLPMQD